MAANWDPNNNYWSTEEIHDLKFNEDKQEHLKRNLSHSTRIERLKDLSEIVRAKTEKAPVQSSETSEKL
ncbi:hypothetical protein RUM44_009284 [Polyplax serrata]|uniref:Uncharacterized protein n=1 Tax=Polyplax serrata TaxID=468196 RepID=A0ABR1ATY7_POLSC